MIRSLHIVVTIKAGSTVMIVVLTGAVHLVNGSPSGLLLAPYSQIIRSSLAVFQVLTGITLSPSRHACHAMAY
jgi:hypothetical protein